MNPTAPNPHAPRAGLWCHLLVAALLVLTVASAPRLGLAGGPVELDLDAYPLDSTNRIIAPRGKVICPQVELVTYAGTHVTYAPKARVHPHFRERLERFEEVLREVAVAHYGRAPDRVQSLGTFLCRRIAAYPEYMSEHGLGNAIDIAAFRFPKLPRGAVAPKGLPKKLHGRFEVSILDHWRGSKGLALHHAHFLHDLARALIARGDIFRVLLGPGFPGHSNHFHFDCAPWRMVEMEQR
jgi:hypothetical protein